MIAVMFVKELRLLLRDGRLLATALCLLALLGVVYAHSVEQQRHAAAEKSAVGASAREQWDKQGIKHPHRGAHFGLYVFRPDSPLAALDPGITPYVGQSLWLEPHRRNMTRFQPQADAGPASRLGELAPAFLLHGLLPLLILSLAFNQITHEREHGTLRMLHSVGVPTGRLLLAKLMAQWVVFAAVLLPWAALATLAALDAGAGTANLDTWLRGLLLLLGYFLFYALIGALGLALAVHVRSGRAALLAAMAMWVVFVALVPRLGGALAQHHLPLPAAADFWRAIQHDYINGLPGDPPLARQVADFEAGLLRQYGVDTLEALPIGINAARRLFRDRYADKVHARHFDALWQRYRHHQHGLRVAALFSPAIAMRNLSMSLAGTSLAHQRDFEEAAEQYRQAVNAAIDEWDQQHTQGLVSYEERYGFDALWQRIPPFHYTAPGWRFAMREAALDALLLAAWALAALALLRLGARRLTP